MKIAVTGKGGSGKTTVSATLARQFSRLGHQVVAVDSDPNPNLGLSLGLSLDRVEAMQPILNALLAAGFTHNDPRPDPDDLLSRYGVDAPDGVRLVATGRIERPTSSCLCCGSHLTTREYFSALPAEDRVVITDLEAGLNDLLWAEPGDGDVVIVVTETSAKSVEIGRRACRIAESMGVKRIVAVANRCGEGDDGRRVADALGVDVIRVPEDPVVEGASQQPAAPLDVDPSSPAMLAIAGLAELLQPM
ncbi:MAG: hypothetical protein CYG61_08355 [Actinobacteria bacterium]|nr:MAG: hypothetical protein CYG61_08355 [Actinomycetota bacterium]